eukprot:jgi/Tetstr1/431890/TSEL_021379.t1
MAAVNRRSRALEGECLECMVDYFEEAYASEPQRCKNTACTACFGPVLAPVAVVERATWEGQFQLAAWNELGRDRRLSNAAKPFKLCGFPSALLANWVNDIVKKCREPSLEAWDRPGVFLGQEKQAKARAKREAQQERRALEEDYLAKRNERLRMLVVPGGRERLAANGNYFPSRDPMFNG